MALLRAACRLRHQTAHVAAALVAAAALGCFGEILDLFELSSAVRAAYPGASISVNVSNGHRSVTIQFPDTSQIEGLSVEAAEEKAREISRFVAQHAGDPIDDLVVIFQAVEERPDGGRVEQRAEFRFSGGELQIGEALGDGAPRESI